MKKFALIFIALITPAFAEKYDVVVFGATSGGVTAAVQAARLGKTVILVEPGKHVGGMTSGGLGWIDTKGTESVGGIAREFFHRVYTHYTAEKIDLDKFGNYGWTVEPHVAEKVYRDMLAEAKVPATFEFRLAEVKKTGSRITSIKDEKGRTYEGKMFIDASYEGDLMARAKVESITGRESRAIYGESIAGIRREPEGSAARSLKIDPYVVPGDPSSGLIPLVQSGGAGKEGDASSFIQAYNYRLCLTKDPKKRIPIEAPASYDSKQYELLARYITAAIASGKPITLCDTGKGKDWALLKIDAIANGKTDTNNGSWISTDFVGYSQEYVEADYNTRARIAKEHENYIRGYLHFLATDSRVPENVREEMKSWGLAKDEFQDTGGWPFQIYVRQARRLVGEYVMTQRDAERKTVIEDSVGMASYSLDSHYCRRVLENGIVIQEGGFYYKIAGPYPISYRAITPKAAQCENLLVPACCSASHVAYASLRMEPVFMILGQASGTAAVQAIDAKSSVQRIDIKQLQKRLLEDGQVLDVRKK